MRSPGTWIISCAWAFSIIHFGHCHIYTNSERSMRSALGQTLHTFTPWQVATTTWLVARWITSGPRRHLVQHVLHLVHSALRRLGLLLNLAKRPGDTLYQQKT